MKTILGAFMAIAVAALACPSQGLSTLYTTDLDGPSEAPPNMSPGTGFATVDLDTMLHTLEIQVEFEDLTGTTTAAHIHGSTDLPGVGTAGVITQLPSFEGFPLGVTSGTYSHTFDTTLKSTWNSAFLGFFCTTLEAEMALDSYLSAGTAYFNIHTTEFPAGEIRGFFAPVSGSGTTPVPEPATLLLAGVGLAGIAGRFLRKRNRS